MMRLLCVIFVMVALEGCMTPIADKIILSISINNVLVGDNEEVAFSALITNSSKRTIVFDDIDAYFFIKRDIELCDSDTGTELSYFDAEDTLLDDGGCIEFNRTTIELEPGQGTNMFFNTPRVVLDLKNKEKILWRVKSDGWIWSYEGEKVRIAQTDGVCDVLEYIKPEKLCGDESRANDLTNEIPFIYPIKTYQYGAQWEAIEIFEEQNNVKRTSDCQQQDVEVDVDFGEE